MPPGEGHGAMAPSPARHPGHSCSPSSSGSLGTEQPVRAKPRPLPVGSEPHLQAGTGLHPQEGDRGADGPWSWY